MTTTMVTTETEQVKRLIEFATDVSQLATERLDLDLHRLLDDLHADLIDQLKEEEQ